MQLCIEQLLYRIKLLIVFGLSFFCSANIYRPSLGKVWLGRHHLMALTQNRSSCSIFISEEKEKPILLRIVCTIMDWTQIFNFDFNLFLKYIKKCLSKNLSKFLTTYMIIIIFFLKIYIQSGIDLKMNICKQVYLPVN